MSEAFNPELFEMTASDDHDWITLHRMRFADPISAWERAFCPAPGAAVWRFCPQHTVGADGLPTRVADIWGAMGIWASRAKADAALADPLTAMPWLGEALASWHCLALPVAHRGAVKWRESVEDGSAIRPAAADPGGPLAIVTSAGFDPSKDDFRPRAIRFTAGVSEVIDWFGTLPSILRRDVFNGGHDGREGFTLSLWRSDDAMREAAYHPGNHRNRMDESRTGALMDRSSFTRLRILSSHGDWDGDPFDALNRESPS